jgi:hypothetical protein
MCEIINFEELLYSKNKNNFDTLVNASIEVVTKHYEQKIEVYTTLLEKMKDIDLNNKDETDKAFAKMEEINSKVCISIENLRDVIINL